MGKGSSTIHSMQLSLTCEPEPHHLLCSSLTVVEWLTIFLKNPLATPLPGGSGGELRAAPSPCRGAPTAVATGWWAAAPLPSPPPSPFSSFLHSSPPSPPVPADLDRRPSPSSSAALPLASLDLRSQGPDLRFPRPDLEHPGLETWEAAARRRCRHPRPAWPRCPSSADGGRYWRGG